MTLVLRVSPAGHCQSLDGHCMTGSLSVWRKSPTKCSWHLLLRRSCHRCGVNSLPGTTRNPPLTRQTTSNTRKIHQQPLHEQSCISGQDLFTAVDNGHFTGYHSFYRGIYLRYQISIYCWPLFSSYTWTIHINAHTHCHHIKRHDKAI